MGYRTYFSLDIEPEPTEELLAEETNDGVSVEGLYNGDYDDMKWYAHEKDMIALSLKYPDFVFTLDGKGEESEDIWRSFYRNGKYYHWVLDYELPEFDESMLIGE